jgi:hypothetical protein
MDCQTVGNEWRQVAATDLRVGRVAIDAFEQALTRDDIDDVGIGWRGAIAETVIPDENVVPEAVQCSPRSIVL